MSIWGALFISVIDFDLAETDDSSHILITVIDAMNKPEETKRFDRKTNNDNGKWIQVGYSKFSTGGVLKILPGCSQFLNAANET